MLGDVAARTSLLLDRPTHACFVDDADGELRGFIAAEHRLLLQSGESVEVTALVVDRTARRQRIGAALVDAVEAWSRARGVGRMVVRSSLARDGAHAFYPGMGYQCSKTQHVYLKHT